MLFRLCVKLTLLGLLISNSLADGQEITPARTKQGRQSTPVRHNVTSAEFTDVTVQVNRFVEKHTAQQVLLVLDIDNTLLAMNQDLGSDQWFDWQSTLQRTNPNSPDLVSSKFDDLLTAQGKLFALGEMHPPEPQLPKLVGQIQEAGVTTIVLTSRGPNFRSSAERELEANGYDLTKTALQINEKRGWFMPFDLQRPNAHGLSAAVMEQIQGRLGRVTYSNGIFMTAGQHKGYMLKTLLARASRVSAPKHKPRTFKAVVFVDDHEKHTERMHEAFADSSMDLATFRYSREDGNVAKFKSSTKRHVVADWKRLEKFMNDNLVRRPQAADSTTD